jgi:hypothetical protein
MSNHILRRLYLSIPFPKACDLHQRLKSGCVAPETRRMLREALQKAGIGRYAA